MILLAVRSAAPPGRASLQRLAVAPQRDFFLGMLELMAASPWWLAQPWARALADAAPAQGAWLAPAAIAP